MRKFNITVNGKTYEVDVEEVGGAPAALMKMENEIMAPRGGKVAAVHASQGSSVNSGDVLIVLE